MFHELVHALNLSEEHHIEDFADRGAHDQTIDNRAAVEEFFQNIFRLAARSYRDVVRDHDDHTTARLRGRFLHVNGRAIQSWAKKSSAAEDVARSSFFDLLRGEFSIVSKVLRQSGSIRKGHYGNLIFRLQALQRTECAIANLMQDRADASAHVQQQHD